MSFCSLSLVPIAGDILSLGVLIGRFKQTLGITNCPALPCLDKRLTP
ncbi:hypothetical protein Poly51_42280 [Rubripirellula tenax]|uniref:Uncharacterized protein n=1 Tax=Rubripirellula tenax TaxID=2528015 RepID=A0A5C6EQL5_9BACT|nr:hypothetical protein Poly51_42280 [Rubripirellula tenax]